MSDELTEDDLARMSSLADAAPAAPWLSFVEGRDHFGGDNFIRTGGMDDASPDIYVTLSYRDDNPPSPAPAAVLDFIAAARQDVPRLIAEIRRRRSR